jgi:drug/metabolite transporter (DMT)-like permease
MKQTTAELLMLCTVFLWGSSYLFMKQGIATFAPFNLIALRFGIAFLVAALVFWKTFPGLRLSTVRCAAVLGFVIFCGFAFLLNGLKDEPTTGAGFLIGTTVVIVPILQAVFCSRVPRRPVILGIALALTGIFFLTAGTGFVLDTGAVLCLISAFFCAWQIILTARFVKTEPVIPLALLQLGFAGLFGLVFTLLFEAPVLPATGQEWMIILELAVLCSAAGYVVQTLVQKYTTPERTGLIFSLESVFAAVFGFFVLHEVLPVTGYIGTALILCGVVIAVKCDRRFSPEERPGPEGRGMLKNT